MKKLFTVLAVILSITSFPASAQWWIYPGYQSNIWPPAVSFFYSVPGASGYNTMPYYYPYYRPYIVVPPVVVQPSVPAVPQYTVPPVPTAPPPPGYQWSMMVDAGCNCVKWVLLPLTN